MRFLYYDASGLLPGAMEIMHKLAIQAAEAAVQPNYPPEAVALLIVEMDGEKNQVEKEFNFVMNVIQESGSDVIRVAQDEEYRLRIWKGRKSAFSAVGRLSPDYIVQDGVVPRSRLGSSLAEIEKLSIKYNLRVANVFHAGDGNLHPLILYDGRKPDALDVAEELAGEILQLCINQGGSITGEHGVGVEKRKYLPKMFNEVEMNTMRRIYSIMDAEKLSNPGKMFLDE